MDNVQGSEEWGVNGLIGLPGLGLCSKQKSFVHGNISGVGWETTTIGVVVATMVNPQVYTHRGDTVHMGLYGGINLPPSSMTKDVEKCTREKEKEETSIEDS
ncbi:unnamed protein product [Fraxinus pennsylvanica]|uniref:Uncharacterized protein n=1 Tax=Fraxinus pennsylvanica TaxID=56036 RepID=A0AAD1ZDB8_9LAMI|nr:unnamed protein product [Fraxinus pennsylvanica]